MGDVILATTLARQLRRTYPDAMIDVVVRDSFADVWAHNPHIRRVWPLVPTGTQATMDAQKITMAESVPGRLYDLVIDLQDNVRSRLLRKGLGASYARIDKHRLEKLALVWFKREPEVVTHVVERYRRAAGALPLAMDHDGPEVWLRRDRDAGAYPVVKPIRVLQRVAMAPGAHHGTKRWLPERFGAVARALHERGVETVLLGGPADKEICDAVAAAAGVTIDRADGAVSVLQTAAVLDLCDLAVTNDTGAMHLATARRKPVVAIFGSTVPALGFTPYGVPHVVVQHDVACRPCSHIGKATCPKGHFLCMRGIEVADVMQAVERLCVS